MALKTDKLTTAKPAASAKVTEADKNVAETTATIEAPNPEIGRLSSSLALVGVLGDPSDPDVVAIRDKDDNKVGEDKKPRIVGYVFKNVGQEPLEYLTSPLAQDWTRKDRMSRIPEQTVKAVLKPGETAYLTHFETAVLMSIPQINLKASGGDVVATGVFNSRNGKSSTETSDSQNQNFQVRVDGGSIRDMEYTNILEFDEKDSENGGKVRSNHRILPQFAEKFSPVAENRGRRNRTGSGSTRAAAAATHNPAAANFLASITKK